MLGAARQEKTGWPFVSDTRSPENRAALGTSWSACVQCAVEGHPAVLASADRDRGSAVSAERKLADSGSKNVIKPVSFSECLPLSFASASLMLKPQWSLEAPDSQRGQ